MLRTPIVNYDSSKNRAGKVMVTAKCYTAFASYRQINITDKKTLKSTQNTRKKFSVVSLLLFNCNSMQFNNSPGWSETHSIYAKLALNSKRPTCFRLPSVRIKDMSHHT